MEHRKRKPDSKQRCMWMLSTLKGPLELSRRQRSCRQNLTRFGAESLWRVALTSEGETSPEKRSGARGRQCTRDGHFATNQIVHGAHSFSIGWHPLSSNASRSVGMYLPSTYTMSVVSLHQELALHCVNPQQTQFTICSKTELYIVYPSGSASVCGLRGTERCGQENAIFLCVLYFHLFRFFFFFSF